MSEVSEDNKNEDKTNNNVSYENKVADEKQKNINEDLKNRLRKYIKKLDDTGTSTTKEESEKVEIETFKQLYRPKLEINDDSYKKIPKFFYKLPRADDVLAQKLREETRAQFLQKKSKELLDNSELKHLWSLLEKSNGSYSIAGNDELTIDYLQFKKIRDEAGPKYRPYFTAEVFGRLQAAEGSNGRVRGLSLFNYVMRRVWLQQTRIGLSLYDVTGQGYLTEHDLESYIAELVPSLAALDGLDSSFSSFYVCTAVRKFLFFLDPLRVGRVRIRDVLSCSFLDDLLELREEDMPMELQEQNWFSAASALRVYGQYLNLDRDHNGMLSINELKGYGSGTLTRAFLQRVFQQCLTYDGEMDYKTYLDLVLALENRRQPAALAYLFRVLDINSQGYLDAFTLNYFFKAIQEQMVAHGAEPVNFDDVKDEIFDMIRPQHPSRITLQDLIRSGHGHTAVSILLELHGFWAYENREALAAAGDHA
ncbi:unnamed protein product [Chilo suppressalis]|uniref:Serine/threonine-protein phosphatase 2A regulatory subunit B'' subunit gamma n=1 Tax=Chilo suppressalis TaxID=168631 RepID=A0ABN8B9A7_CHISP|nr:hypothetical protein evm_004293 [Chilo suppressalis]CAH0403056.1 unnamed protein product [Chilo suppressalis]